MIKTKKQMYMVIGIFALVLFLGGTTYAFFNYTRTGVANNIRTGRIYFNTAQSNTLNLTNVFPMSATDAGNANLDAVSVRIYGDTTYSGGEEFEISIVDVNNTIGSGQSVKTIPINYIASYSATPVQSGDPNVIGTNSDSYFTARGQSSPVYQLKTTGEATNGEQVLIGYIPSGATGIDGTLTIKAYLDSSKIVISDTYNDGNTPTDNMGTPASFGEGKTVLTTTEWNALQIKAVSQEGTWIEEPADGTIDSCPGCKFIYTTNTYYYSANNVTSSPLSTLQTFANNNDILYDDYREVVTNSGNSYFLGFKFDGSGAITNAYACGIKGEDPNNGKPFCIEGALEDTYGGNSTARTTLYNANTAFLNQLYGLVDSETGYGCNNYSTEVYCIGSVGAGAYSDGDLNNSGGEVYTSGGYVCTVGNRGTASCYEN